MLFPLKDTPLLAAGYLIITGELVSFGKFLVLDLRFFRDPTAQHQILGGFDFIKAPEGRIVRRCF